jgi:hypothetical protein
MGYTPIEQKHSIESCSAGGGSAIRKKIQKEIYNSLHEPDVNLSLFNQS